MLQKPSDQLEHTRRVCPASKQANAATFRGAACDTESVRPSDFPNVCSAQRVPTASTSRKIHQRLECLSNARMKQIRYNSDIAASEDALSSHVYICKTRGAHWIGFGSTSTKPGLNTSALASRATSTSLKFKSVYKSFNNVTRCFLC